MQWGPAIRAAAALAVVFVVLVFLFPAGHGPYPTTHGPVTALRALRAAVLMLLAMASVASTLNSIVPRLAAAFAPHGGTFDLLFAHIFVESAHANRHAVSEMTCVLLC